MDYANFVCYISNITVILILGGAFFLAPVIIRKQFLFGVRIPEEERGKPPAIKIIKRFRAGIIAVTLIAIIIATAQFIFAKNLSVISVMYIPFVHQIALFLVYIPSWKSAKALKAKEGWVIPQIHAADTRAAYINAKTSSVPWEYYALSFVAALACVIIGVVLYPELPAQIPTHFGLNGEADAWSDKSLIEVLMIPLVWVGIVACMILCAVSMTKAKLQINQDKLAISFAQNKSYRRGMQHCIGILTLCMDVMFALTFIASTVPGFIGNRALMVAALMLAFVMPLPLIGFAIKAGQGGCRLTPKLSHEDIVSCGFERPAEDDNSVSLFVAPAVNGRSDDDNWLIGMFYHNKDDAALFVEGRFGANIGFNYAKPFAKILVLVVIFGLIATYAWLTPIMLK